MKQVIVITGASSGFGALAARRLADAGHTVYAGMRATAGRNSAQVEAAKQYAADHGVDLRAIEMDVASEGSCEAAVRQIISEQGQLNVVVHNAGHMSFGPAEAFTPEQFAELYAAVPVPETALKGLASLEPPDADAGSVAEAIVKVVDAPFGKRPFRVHVDPSQDGAEIVNGVADRVRAEMFRRIGLEDLLHPALRQRENR
jgi:hypothetical protein